LVMVQLSGGNDGLNTLIPFADDRYYQARPNLAVSRTEVLKLTGAAGFHPQMGKLHHVFEHELLAVVQGVGYPNPNRSHFRSLEIWQTSETERVLTTGWLGRYVDAECRGSDNPAPVVNFGDKQPLTLAAERPRVITLENPALLKWQPRGEAAEAERRAFGRINQSFGPGPDNVSFLARVASGAQSFYGRLEEAMRRYRSAVVYPEFRFSQNLKLVAQMITAEFPTRIYYVELPGFDTHAAQSNRHAALLQELSEGLGSFLHDLHKQGHLQRTLVVTFSEFGRRVAENRSGGTDHGAGSMLFLAGGGVKGGFYGTAPDLEDLQSGDLKHQVDFRSVYATVLEQWLGAGSEPILGSRFPTLPLFPTRS
ncbi:MAG: DUF1501 domain-containing protein, partial [SAR202 cluster bacterium]|nr:DUF1501 domain-containing protein [SAR202 cluster bacterium]